MVDWLRLARDVVAALWNRHYHIPRVGYAALLPAGLVLIGISRDQVIGGAGVFLVGVGIQGLIRWSIESRPAAAIAVARFAGEREAATSVQREVVTALQDHLGPELRYRVLPVPATVGRDQRKFAAALRARLKAGYLLYGDVRPSGEGVTVYPRLVQPTHRSVEHWDWFTRDRTPQRTVWRTALDKLTPSREAEDVEYPYGFAGEVEAVVRSIEGNVWMLVGEPAKAERVLREALEIAGPSTSHAVDEVRVAQAKALREQAKNAEALELLRQRARQEDASPELLRTLAGFLTQEERPSRASRNQAIALLRQAAVHRGDPLRDMTIYNLAQQLAMSEDPEARDEAIELFRDLLRTKESHYSKAWYVKRMIGAWHWTRAARHQSAGEEEEARAEARLAAYWYTRSIRARPKLWVRWDRLGWQILVRRILPRPVMFANATDALCLGGRRWMCGYYSQRELRLRRRFARTGGRAMWMRDWDKAYAYFDWAWVGRTDDLDLMASVSAAVAAEQRGDTVRAYEQWRRAVGQDSQLARSLRDRLLGELGLATALS